MAYRAALALMLLSGFAGLGYQIVWTQQSTLWLGHEAASVLAVVTAFFGGLALGALAFGPRIDRCAHPARWFAACEGLIALWSVVLALGLAPISASLSGLIGAQPSPLWQWSVAFAGCFLVLLPATAAMGATLPAMERLTQGLAQEGPRIAALYACNTFGALLGVLAAAFWLVPQFGLTRTALACALLNGLAALCSLALGSSLQPRPRPTRPPSGHGTLALLACTGLLGIGYEVLVVRVLSQVAEDTVYTFAILLAVYLVGSALGASIYQRRLAHALSPGKLRERLLCLQAAACLLGSASLWAAEGVRQLLLDVAGASMASALAAEAAMGLAAFLLPTVVMGALFSHLCRQARASRISLGHALGCNTLGAAAAPLVFGVLLAPALGPKACLLLVAGGYLLLATRRTWARPMLWGPALALALMAALAPPLAFVDVPEGGRILSYREGTLGAVSVVEDGEGVARLRINNRQQEGSSATLLADARQALLPLLLHPAPRHALFLGLGTGVTATAAAADATLSVDAVELLPEVIAASAHFTEPFKDSGAPARLHVLAADARRYVRASTQRYEVIVADNFHPARSGSGALYTVEHFRAVRERLADEGLFCQWLPLHQLDLTTLRSIVRSFNEVFPQGWAMLSTHSLDTPVLGLVARRDGERLALQSLRERLLRATLTTPPRRLADFGITDEFALLGGVVGGPDALARFAREAPANTDDRPIVAYRAPLITYAPDSQPRERLLALLRELRIEPGELLQNAGTESVAAQRLAAYWAARDRFVEAGQGVQAVASAQRMLVQVREPLLGVLRISPDFRPAYDPLLRLASALALSDPVSARLLLEELRKIQPARPEADQALQRLIPAH